MATKLKGKLRAVNTISWALLTQTLQKLKVNSQKFSQLSPHSSIIPSLGATQTRFSHLANRARLTNRVSHSSILRQAEVGGASCPRFSSFWQKGSFYSCWMKTLVDKLQTPSSFLFPQFACLASKVHSPLPELCFLLQVPSSLPVSDGSLSGRY